MICWLQHCLGICVTPKTITHPPGLFTKTDSRHISMKIFSLTLVLLAISIACGQVFPQQSIAGNRTDQELRNRRSSLQKLHKGMKLQQEKVRESQMLAEGILSELEKLDRNYQRQQENLLEMRQQVAEQEELLAAKEKDLEQTEMARESIRRHLETRLRVLYTKGGTDLINVVFSSKTLPELLLFNDSFHTLIRYDRTLFDVYQKSVHELHRSREAHELQKALLDSVIVRLEEEKEKLDTIHKEKNELLKKIQTKEKLYGQAIKEMQKAETGLIKTLRSLQRKKIQEEKQDTAVNTPVRKKEPQKKGFFDKRGLLPPPVQGMLICRFGEQQNGSLHNLAKNGIVIKAADESDVHAIYPGKVIFADYKRGYGNMIIIDHGMKYYTVTARLSEMLKKDGDRVDKNEVIGKTSDIATLFDEGIYFEIRQDSHPLDPLIWLAPNCLQITPPAL